MTEYYSQSIAQILKNLDSTEAGLSTAEAQARLLRDGTNELPKSKSKVHALKILVSQFVGPLVLILIVAAIISGILHEWVDMTVIVLTVVVNGIVGFVQEYKANNALDKLKHMIRYHAVVVRDGQKMKVPGTDVVVGDVMYLEAGDRVQADGRIIQAKDCQVNEASLTGESVPRDKTSEVLRGEHALADQSNMVFRGTTLRSGRAKILVTATGTQTEIGKIASLVQKTVDDDTPLQKELGNMARMMGIIIVTLAVIIFVLGDIISPADTTLFQLFEISVAVAVAAIPEGLVISLTVILAIGMQFILKRNALVRRLVAAETLGSVNVICTDKTGTLTEGNMSVTRVITATDDLNQKELQALDHATYKKHADIVYALRIGILANDGIAEQRGEETRYIGDTTDTAFLKLGDSIDLSKQHLEYQYRRIDDIPFTSEHKYIATLHENETTHLFVKGAPEILLQKSSWYIHNGTKKRLTKKQLTWFLDQHISLTKEGLRVIAVCQKVMNPTTKNIKPTDVDTLTFVGLVALADPLRPDVQQVIARAHDAGIRVMMITGDHQVTAQSIARELGLPYHDDNICTGVEIDAMDDTDFARALDRISVFARVNPTHKIRIVQALQARGDIVAMTGDGVNDAPALKGADIGVAVGSGTDVAKEVADVVLLDDNFKTIIHAVEEGRGIYENIKKIVLYLMAGSFAEVFLVLGSILIGLPLPISPVQILWVNLIQDSLPNMALAFDRGRKDIMNQQPRKRNASIFDRDMKIMVTVFTIFINTILFGIFFYYLHTTQDLALARTITFAGLAIGCLIYIYSVRNMRHNIWHEPIFDNKYLNGAVVIGLVLLLGAIYVTPLQLLLRTVSLDLVHWLVIVGFGCVNLIIIEIMKWFFVGRKHRNTV